MHKGKIKKKNRTIEYRKMKRQTKYKLIKIMKNIIYLIYLRVSRYSNWNSWHRVLRHIKERIRCEILLSRHSAKEAILK